MAVRSIGAETTKTPTHHHLTSLCVIDLWGVPLAGSNALHIWCAHVQIGLSRVCLYAFRLAKKKQQVSAFLKDECF
jgi:hypothetical protein